jgi:hypothetical protein
MQSCYYAVKYATKVQGPIDSEAVVTKFRDSIARSFKSRDAAEQKDPLMTPEQRGACKLYSLAWHFSNFQEVSSTMAAYCLLRNGLPMIASHDITSLVLISGINALKNDEQVTHLYIVQFNSSLLIFIHSSFHPYIPDNTCN